MNAQLLPDCIYEVDTSIGGVWNVWTLKRHTDSAVRVGAWEYTDVDPSRLQDVLAGE